MRKRATVYVDSEKLKMLKALLALDGLTLSEWVRGSIDTYLNQKEDIVHGEKPADDEKL